MTPDPILRVRQLALTAMIAAGGTARLAQVERVGLVQRASQLLDPPRCDAVDPRGKQTLLAAYCGRVGKSVPARFSSAAHLAAMDAQLRHGRR